MFPKFRHKLQRRFICLTFSSSMNNLFVGKFRLLIAISTYSVKTLKLNNTNFSQLMSLGSKQHQNNKYFRNYIVPVYRDAPRRHETLRLKFTSVDIYSLVLCNIRDNLPALRYSKQLHIKLTNLVLFQLGFVLMYFRIWYFTHPQFPRRCNAIVYYLPFLDYLSYVFADKLLTMMT